MIKKDIVELCADRKIVKVEYDESNENCCERLDLILDNGAAVKCFIPNDNKKGSVISINREDDPNKKRELFKACIGTTITNIYYCASSEWLYETLQLTLDNGLKVSCSKHNFDDNSDIKVVNLPKSDDERLLELLKYSKEAIAYWFNMCECSPANREENDHFKAECDYFLEKMGGK